MNKSHLLVFIALLTVFVSGCKKSAGTYPVTGKITVDGQVVEGISVVFSPVGEGEPGSGATDATGVYSLKTSIGEPGTGVKPGDYKVTVSKMFGEWDGKTLQANPGGEPIKVIRSKQTMPNKYTTKSLTPLSATVTAEKEKNVFDFDIKTK